MKKWLLSIALGLGLQGCLVTPDYEAIASINQTGESETHFSRVVSRKSSIVSVEVDSFIDSKFDYPSVYLGFHNRLAEATSITLDNITVEADGEILIIKDPEVLRNERQNRLARLNILYNGHQEPRKLGQRRRINQRRGQGINGEFTAQNNDYSRYVEHQLMDNEIEPNMSYGGYIAFDRLDRKVKNYKVTVWFNDEEHVFIIKRSS